MNPESLVERLRSYESCSDDDVDEAADMLEFLLSRFQMYSPQMNGQHSWRFRGSGWPMGSLRGPDIETAVRSAMAEAERGG